MHCDETWQDVFLTKPDYGGPGVAAPEQDDEFVAPVMSVQLQYQDNSKIWAKPDVAGSNWLMLGFPSNADAAEITKWRALEAGDMIRVGGAGNGGFTDYLTVMETCDIDYLVNTTDKKWQLAGKTDPTAASLTAVLPTGNGINSSNKVNVLNVYETPATSATNYVKEDATGGLPIGSLRAVRVNYAIDASELPGQPTDLDFAKTTGVTSQFRGEVTTFYPTAGRAYAGANAREKLYYPCYKQRRWRRDSALKLQMPTNIKQIRAIKLCGYSMFYKPKSGLQQAHERKEDDWFALRVREIGTNNTVLSNNSNADGALHIVHVGTAGPSAGSVELYSYEPTGLACATFTPTNLPSLTVEIVDRNGQEAHFGRMHIWLRVLVTHG